MPTNKKRFYCIKCGRRKVASKMIAIACVRIRYGTEDNFKIHLCNDCCIRFRDFLNMVKFPESVALADTPKKGKGVQMAVTLSKTG